MSVRYSKEFKDRAVRLLAESRENHSTETKALRGVAGNPGVAAESLRRWWERADADAAAVSGESVYHRVKLCVKITGIGQDVRLIGAGSAADGRRRGWLFWLFHE